MQELSSESRGSLQVVKGAFLGLLCIFMLASATKIVSAAVSSTTNCQSVSCQSDSSVKGSEIFAAGTEVCDAVGMDYAPACNESRCIDQSSGHHDYACVSKVQTTTTGSGSTTSGTGGTTTGTGGTSTGTVSTSKTSTGETSSIETTETSGCENGDFEKISGVCFPKNTELPDPADGVLGLLDNLLRWLLAIFAILAIGAFVISGIQYLISAGDDDMIETAKRNMKWSAVGVLVGFSGWVILQAISGALSGAVGF